VSYLIDTDILISAAGGWPDAQQLITDVSSDGAAISIISLGEIFEGAVGEPEPAASQRLSQLRTYLNAFPIMPLNDPVMERFARLRSDLRSQGQLIPDFDILIAATALEYNLTLVTRNLRHFQRIPSLAIYEQN
jgi:predicted nucleic acid-binding protein